MKNQQIYLELNQLISIQKHCTSQKTPHNQKKQQKISSKVIGNELVTLISETLSTEALNINTTPHKNNFSKLPLYFEEVI